MSEEEYLSSFRFRQLDIPYLAQVLHLPEKFICPNQIAALTEEALCILVRRFAYPCQYVDLTPQFGRSPQESSLIANKVMDEIYEMHGHLVANIRSPISAMQNSSLIFSHFFPRRSSRLFSRLSENCSMQACKLSVRVTSLT